MKIDVLFAAFNDDEREEMFKLITDWKIPNPIIINTTEKLTPVREWVKLQPDISERLIQILLVTRFFNRPCPDEDLPFRFIEQINRKHFLRIRNAGLKSWDEFVKLRGY